MESRSSLQHVSEGKGKEKVKEANEVKLDVAEDSDNGEIESREAGVTIESSPTHETSRIEVYARSLVKRAKDKCFIHKVHSGLRNKKSAMHYEPVLVSIGPYHHGNTPLQDMEKYKIQYSKGLLDKKESTTRYVEALKNEGEPEALDCYVDNFQMDSNAFGECMVLDACFMIELFRRNRKPDEYPKDKRNNMLLNMRWMKPRLACDMLLFENQIPLFVLRHMFALTEQVLDESDLVHLALGFFEFNGKRIPNLNPTTGELDNIPHLLGLVYKALVPKTPISQHCSQWESREFIESAVELQGYGVKFHKAADDKVFYDIDFQGQALRIPQLVIEDNTESFFRNLVAYEQYSEHHSLHQVSDYLLVMRCLISSSKDVALLRRCGIIDNKMGHDEKVSTMFNTLCSGVYFDQDKFFYTQMFGEVNKFCKNRRNMWIAKLKNEYFNSPWAVIQVQATAWALLLAAAQVVIAVYTIKKS